MDTLPERSIIIVEVIVFVIAVINSLARSSTVSVGDPWLLEESENGNGRAKRLHKILNGNSEGAINGFELMSALLFIVFSFLFVYIAQLPICDFLKNKTTLGSNSAFWIAFAISVFLAWFVFTSFCTIIPEYVGAKYSKKLSLFFSAYSKIIYIAMKPFLFLFDGFSKGVSFLFGVKTEDIAEEVTEEEIRMMVDIGSENGTIDDDEKQMIHNIFEMDDKPVSEIMTHRTEACILWLEDDIDEWKKTIDETNHTRYPVCGETVDDVEGIVNSRDFYRMLLNDSKDINSIMRDVYFIPDSIKADELLSQMQRENEHMGIVIDEYGGFQGIVTQEDLIEEIVGELYSEYDEIETIEESSIEKVDDNKWKIDGSAEIEDVEEELDIKIKDGDFNTFAGLVLSELKTIPEDGEKFEIEIDNMKIKVISVVEHRIEKAIVSVIPKKDEE